MPRMSFGIPATFSSQHLFTSPVTEYNLANESIKVSRSVLDSQPVKYGDWGLVSSDGTADYDFTVSDCPLLFLASTREIQKDIHRERLDDRTKEGSFQQIRESAGLDLMYEIEEAGLWKTYIRMRYDHNDPWQKDELYPNFSPDSPLAFRLSETPPLGGPWLHEVRGNGNHLGG